MIDGGLLVVACIVLVILVYLIPRALGWVNSLIPSHHQGTLLWAVIIVLIFIGGVAGSSIRRNRAARRKLLESEEFRRCPRCAYSLVGLGDHGACPECGRAYELQHLIWAWRRRYPDSD